MRQPAWSVARRQGPFLTRRGGVAGPIPIQFTWRVERRGKRSVCVRVPGNGRATRVRARPCERVWDGEGASERVFPASRLVRAVRGALLLSLPPHLAQVWLPDPAATVDSSTKKYRTRPSTTRGCVLPEYDGITVIFTLATSLVEYEVSADREP
eukprot:scaffold4285_cov109-Isochrysis_galbana.AAC.5